MATWSGPRSLAVIPARGGSKGIPRKNLAVVGGLPLLAHAVLAARNAASVEAVVVSTDDAEIAEVARRFGAGVVERPAELATDTASSESALLHALDTLEHQGLLPDWLLFVQCTSPLTTAADLDGLARTVLEAGADSGLTVARTSRFLWRRGPDGAVGVNHDPAMRPRRQDREPEYVETGGAYLMRVTGFRAARHRFFGRTVLHEVPAERAHEIDTPDELALAELMLRRGGGVPPIPDPLGAVVFDFDGVMTDDRVIVDQNGVESVACSRGDGLGLGMLREAGVPLLVLSKERNPVVGARCAKLKLECIQGIDDKESRLAEWLAARGLGFERIVYVGNDINDLPCLRRAGLSAAPADSHPAVLAEVRWVLGREGGRGAVRELCDHLLDGVNGTRK